MPRRDKRRYGRTAKDVRRGGLGIHSTPISIPIKTINAWLRVNGSDVTYSNAIQSSTNLSEREVMSFKYVTLLTAGDYIELMFTVNDLNLRLNAFAAGGSNPATPSIFVNVVKVR